jgi:hypothetical protein
MGCATLILGGCGQNAAQGHVQPYAKVLSDEPVNHLPSNLPQKFTPNFTRYPLIASKTLKIVHRRDCALTAAIPTADRDYFRAWSQAGQAGYKPCDACRPDLP